MVPLSFSSVKIGTRFMRVGSEKKVGEWVITCFVVRVQVTNVATAPGLVHYFEHGLVPVLWPVDSLNNSVACDLSDCKFQRLPIAMPLVFARQYRPARCRRNVDHVAPCKVVHLSSSCRSFFLAFPLAQPKTSCKWQVPLNVIILFNCKLTGSVRFLIKKSLPSVQISNEIVW